MRRATLSLVLLCAGSTVSAHHPNRQAQPVHPRVDVIGPLGNNLPPSYRWKYNRPSRIGGKIAYWIAPSSQEAMAWHAAQHAGAYRLPHRRSEQYYFHPKPWEALPVGPRVPVPEEMIEEPSPPPEELSHEGNSAPAPIIIQPVTAAANDSRVAVGPTVDTADLPDPSTIWAGPLVAEPDTTAIDTELGAVQDKVDSPAAATALIEEDSAAAELRKLRAENRRLRMERELLKKATGLFGTQAD